MENMVELENRDPRTKETGESVTDLLIDLDILCKKLELLGKETLIFCSGADNAITSGLASFFFESVETIFSKFKEFCEKQKQQEDRVNGGYNVSKDTNIKNEHLADLDQVDAYHDETDDEYGDQPTLEIVTDDVYEKESETVTTDIKIIVENSTELETGKRYQEDGKAGEFIQKTKLDGTDFFSERKNLLPKVSLKRIDAKKSNGRQSQKGKKYLEINNEKLLLLTPEETGLDFTQDENNPFNCLKCDKIAGSLSKLREHLTKVHKIKIGHQCVCGRFFQDSVSYEKHVDSKLYNMYHHECKECKGVYPSVAALKSHTMRVHDEKSREMIVNQEQKLGDFPCLKCETIFHHEQHLIDHNDNLPDCDVAVKEDNEVEKTLGDTELTYKGEDGIEVKKSTYREIMDAQKESPHVCPCCRDSFNRKSNFQRHLLRHLSHGTHLCLICGNKFKGKDGLQRHLNQHMAKPYNCSSCRNRFATQAELTLHVNSRCKEGNREDFKCDLCDHTASNMSALQVHKNMHAGLKPFECRKCGKNFATKSSLDRHDTVRHQDATPFQCSQCGKAFKTKDNLKKHSKVHQDPKFSCEVCGKGWVDRQSLKKHMQVHTKTKPFICEVCGKACTEKGNLNKHMRTHTKEKPFVCELCGKAYGRKSLLDNHRRLHTGEKPYKCTKEGCDKAFRSYSNLKQHIRNHSPTHPYVCDICGKMFKQPGRLNHHRKDHTVEFRWPCAYCDHKFGSIFKYKSHLAKIHPDKKNDIETKSNIRLYECEMCHKMYGDKDDLTRHIYIHQNIKPFSCQYCGKDFNDKSNMRQHEKIHTGVKHHWCQVCKKGFIHKRDWRNHMITNHKHDDEDSEEDVKPPREKRTRRKALLNMNKMEGEGSYADFTPVESQESQGQDLDMHLIPPDYEVQDSKKAVETVIEEQPRDLSIQPALSYISSHPEIPPPNFPVAAVNAATGQIEPLMLIENYHHTPEH